MKQANPKARMMSEQTIIAMISAVPRPPPESGPEADEAPIYALASEFANAKAKQSLIVWCLTTSLSIWIKLIFILISFSGVLKKKEVREIGRKDLGFW